MMLKRLSWCVRNFDYNHCLIHPKVLIEFFSMNDILPDIAYWCDTRTALLLRSASRLSSILITTKVLEKCYLREITLLRPKHSKSSYRPFYSACRRGHLSAVRIFLRNGFCPKRKDALAVRHAAINNHTPVVECLLDSSRWTFYEKRAHLGCILSEPVALRRVEPVKLIVSRLGQYTGDLDDILLNRKGIRAWIRWTLNDGFLHSWEELPAFTQSRIRAILSEIYREVDALPERGRILEMMQARGIPPRP